MLFTVANNFGITANNFTNFSTYCAGSPDCIVLIQSIVKVLITTYNSHGKWKLKTTLERRKCASIYIVFDKNTQTFSIVT